MELINKLRNILINNIYGGGSINRVEEEEELIDSNKKIIKKYINNYFKLLKFDNNKKYNLN